MTTNNLSLDIKYRPKNLKQVIGNDLLKESLDNVLKRSGGFPSSFLFQGPTGCGKTTLARITAKRLGGSSQTTHELNISNLSGVDTAREMINKAKFAPFGGKKKIYILNECHKASNSFWNAMLEILEEPPSYCHFILATTEPQKLLPTVRNRCSVFSVTSLKRVDIVKLLRIVCKKEEVEMNDELLTAIKKIATVSEGCARQALVWLDMIIDMEDDEQMLETVKDFSMTKESVFNLFKALIAKKPWPKVSSILNSLEDEPERVRYALLTMADSKLLKDGSIQAWDIIDLFQQQPFYHKASLTAKCFELIVNEE